MEVIDNLCEAVGRLLIAGIIDKKDLDIPPLHGESLHLRRLVAGKAIVSMTNECFNRDKFNLHVALFRDKLHDTLDL